MQVTVWKTDDESNERCITRFNKKVQGSRKMLKLRAERYHTKSRNKRKQREYAVISSAYRAKNAKQMFY